MVSFPTLVGGNPHLEQANPASLKLFFTAAQIILGSPLTLFKRLRLSRMLSCCQSVCGELRSTGLPSDTQKVHLGSSIIIIISAGVQNSLSSVFQFALLALVHSPVAMQEKNGDQSKRDGVFPTMVGRNPHLEQANPASLKLFFTQIILGGVEGRR